MKFRKNDDAVSPVIGVILMVAITVILAAVIAAFVFGMGPPKSTPTASLKITATSNSADTINITHNGGDSIDLAKTKAIVEQDNSRMVINTLSSTTSTFQTGDEIGITAKTTAAEANAVTKNKAGITSGTIGTAATANLTSGKVTVTLIDTDSSQQIQVVVATVS